MATTRSYLTGQHDLFIPEPDLDSFKGMTTLLPNTFDTDIYDVEYLTSPKWNEGLGQWVCLANVRGMLCTVAVDIWVEGEA